MWRSRQHIPALSQLRGYALWAFKRPSLPFPHRPPSPSRRAVRALSSAQVGELHEILGVPESVNPKPYTTERVKSIQGARNERTGG